MAYNPELVKQLLGDKVAELFDGTIEIEKANGENFAGLIVGDKLTFKFKVEKDFQPRQFIVTSGK